MELDDRDYTPLTERAREAGCLLSRLKAGSERVKISHPSETSGIF